MLLNAGLNQVALIIEFNYSVKKRQASRFSYINK